MAKGKKNKVGGKARGTPRHRNPSGGHPSKSPRAPRSSRGGWTSEEDFETATFTLRDAAAARDSSFGSYRGGSSGFSLRHKSIGFVPSSEPTPMKPQEDADDDDMEEDQDEGEDLDEEDQAEIDEVDVEIEEVSNAIPEQPQTQIPSRLAEAARSDSARATQAARPPSPSGSASSEEVVLFRGRNAPAAKTQKPSQVEQKPISSVQEYLGENKDPWFKKPTSRSHGSLPTRSTPKPMPQAKKPQPAAAPPQASEDDVAKIIGDILDAQDAEDAEDDELDGDDDASAWEDEKDAEWISQQDHARLLAQRHVSSHGKAASHGKIHARMPTTTSRQSKRRRQSAMDKEDAAIEAALADYVENMRENGDMEDLDDTDGVDSSRVERDGWNSSDLEDFDELSTSEEILEAVEHVLSKRHRPSGLQYLVVWEGQSVDEARWIPHMQLNMQGAAELIAAFEEEEKNIPEYDEDEDDEEDEEDDDDDDEDEDEDVSDDEVDSRDDEEAFADEADLIERRQARLSDEKLARLLAKQEALGLGSDELMLFDQGFADNDPDELSDSFIPFARSSRQKKRKSSRKLRNLEVLGDDLEDMDLDDEIPSDGDNYGAFDIMDRDRASISKDKRNDPLTWGLSDSDQAQDLRDAWAADRRKKKVKKQEREELRAQGLLGKKNKFKPDLKARYNDGMSLDQLGRELEDFLLNDDMQSRALPPMDKRDRKAVHEIASMFGLKSLSKGSGKSRFPVLQKTSKTLDFDEILFARMRSTIDRRFYGRMDKKGKSPRGPPMVRRSGGMNARADISYREGDVVGANAPVIGAENRGRALLEKMGWSMGMVLGREGTGIATPIEHVVKNSRAGLG